MQVTGLCLGATNISLVTVEKSDDQVKIIDVVTKPHEGEPSRVLLEMLAGKSQVRLAATGRKFRHLLKIPTVSEPETVELAYRYSRGNRQADAVVSAGGETFILYEMDDQGRIANVHTGNKCASGTGEFFLQQVTRMGFTPAEAIAAAAGAAPYPVASRCSVFCKSDCTHALNKGQDKGTVVAGLCQMMAQKILELVEKAGAKNVFLVGGTAQNTLMVDFLRPHVEVAVPDEAPYFEALGAALWGLDQDLVPLDPAPETLLAPYHSSFSFQPPLKEARHLVDFKTMPQGKAEAGDRLILGLDVGSTTTKAVLVREADYALVGSIYLRTSGDPVGASRRCYEELARQVPADVNIVGLGVTGSGRYIAGLHALTPGVINEIIAHAAAAVYFDPAVDTILEIGGQDAKYTYLVNGVPADYAMNEACSAGTGSFLEEAAKESLEVEMTAIGPLAMEAASPPNFNDQCAAFIGSDIKTAVQEGNSSADILAGLVYSIGLNYLTRVKCNRPVGQKIFMQGGVCYNQAVPVAMAALLDKEIVVPPEPGLMGAFGVALEVDERLKRGLLDEASYDLVELAEREIEYDQPFICPGDKGCDRGCSINVLKIKGKRYPFGGACSRYSGVVRGSNHDAGSLDFVFERERVLFQRPGPAADEAGPGMGRRVGFSQALMVNELYPLYHRFFTELGFEVVLADRPDPSGQMRLGAPFCYPVEQAHGYMVDLLAKETDFIFLPQLKGLPTTASPGTNITCPLVQGEPYYLRAAFPELAERRVLSPVLDFSAGYDSQGAVFEDLAQTLGVDQQQAAAAYRAAADAQLEFKNRLKELGTEFLAELEANPDQQAIVVFGRSYNAFSGAANMGIPHKFAARGLKVIPCDFLTAEEQTEFPNMYWATGQVILAAAQLVRDHPQLFGVYVTNFSCGPDSFLVGYFRDIMGDKPSLTLELDGHSADAGVDTRVEAFLDIVQGYLDLREGRVSDQIAAEGAATVLEGSKVFVRTAQGEKIALDDPRVRLVIPSMGDRGNAFIAAVMRRTGVRASALPEPGERELMLGRSHTNCKECLPLQLTVGSLLRYMEEHELADDELLVYFMPQASGPCRFGQYQVFINQLLKRLDISNVATLSLTSENSYGGLGLDFTLGAWIGLIMADVMFDIRNALLVLAKDKDQALAVYERERERLIDSLTGSWGGMGRALKETAAQLGRIELTGSLEEVPQVAVLGEIYVRADAFSRRGLIEYLAEHGIVSRVAPVNEWLYYCDYLLQEQLLGPRSRGERLNNRLQGFVKVWVESKIKRDLSATGLYDFHLTKVEPIIDGVRHLLSPALTGEAILTIGGALSEVIDEVAGVIALGPFGCMPNRIAEAVAGKTIAHEKLKATDDKELAVRVLERQSHLPFMAIETDGNVFPQVVEARLESFVLQVKRLHRVIQEERARPDRYDAAGS